MIILSQTGQGRVINQERRPGSGFVYVYVCIYMCVHVKGVYTYICGYMCVCMSMSMCVKTVRAFPCTVKAPACEPLGVSGRSRCEPAEGNWF